MPRNAQVLAPSDHTLLLSTLRTCLEIVRDVALVVTTVYVIHLEVTATTSDNYESTRRLGLSSTDECSVARRLYDCQTNVVLSTDVPVVGKVPLCYSSTLQVNHADDGYTLCLGKEPLEEATDDTSIPQSSYTTLSSLPAPLQCLHDSDYVFPDMSASPAPVSSASNQTLMGGLSSPTLNAIFPSGITYRNYYPYSGLIIVITALAVVMRVAQQARARSRVLPSHSGGGVYISRRERSNGYRSVYRSPTPTPSRHAQTASPTTGLAALPPEEAQEVLSFRANIFLNCMVFVLLMLSSASMKLMTVEDCPTSEKTDLYSKRAVDNERSMHAETELDGEFPERPLEGEDLYSFCSALDECNVDVRSVVHPFGYSSRDYESEGGFGVRRSLTTLAWVIFLSTILILYIRCGGSFRFCSLCDLLKSSRARPDSSNAWVFGSGPTRSGSPRMTRVVAIAPTVASRVSLFERWKNYFNKGDRVFVNTVRIVRWRAWGYSSERLTNHDSSPSELPQRGTSTELSSEWTVLPLSECIAEEKLRKKNQLLAALHTGVAFECQVCRQSQAGYISTKCECACERRIPGVEVGDIDEVEALMLIYFDEASVCSICLEAFVGRTSGVQKHIRKYLQSMKGDGRSPVDDHKIAEMDDHDSIELVHYQAQENGARGKVDEFDNLNAPGGILADFQSVFLFSPDPRAEWRGAIDTAHTDSIADMGCDPILDKRVYHIESSSGANKDENKDENDSENEDISDCVIGSSDESCSALPKMIRCGHVFHVSCIARWAVNTGTCPVCRAPCVGVEGYDGAGNGTGTHHSDELSMENVSNIYARDGSYIGENDEDDAYA